jgi:hypothetical protein
VQPGRGRPLRAAINQLNIASPAALASLDNHGRLFVNFYSSSLLCVRPAAVVAASIMTALVITFHALTFA